MINKQNFTLPDLVALYSKPYDEAMERWRAIGAIDKAAHILEMTRDCLLGLNITAKPMFLRIPMANIIGGPAMQMMFAVALFVLFAL
jgi:hypothetical protein